MAQEDTGRKNSEIRGEELENLRHFKVSVRNLVSFSIPEDTTWSFISYAHLKEGAQAHCEIQNRHRAEGTYRSEVYLSYQYRSRKYVLEISGRADGVWELEDRVIIHEIKTTSRPLSDIHEDFSEAHWAQGKCYAFIYAAVNSLDRISVRLTYSQGPGGQEKSFERTFTFSELEKFIKSLIRPYAAWAMSQARWCEIRDQSIKALLFPFPGYREGQRLLAYNVYKCIQDGRRLFVQAPTGTGKTMGVLYPSIKALADGTIQRIFYLTAKNTTQAVAENAYRLLAGQGLRLRVLTLTAKDKICPHPVRDCSPEKCPYIQGYGSRYRKAVRELIKKTDAYNRENITETAMKHGLCPFELSLDLALQCDLIICDYNYVFDPRVSLKRFFQQKTREDCVILVDEAHNLFGRAREMYSATISKESVLGMSRLLKKDLPAVSRALRRLSRVLATLEKETAARRIEVGGIGYCVYPEYPEALDKPLSDFINETERWMLARGEEEKEYEDDLITLFFDLLHFKNISELYSSEYRTLMTGLGSRLKLTLLCLDPGIMLGRIMDTARSSILFSATLSPLPYFRDILGGRGEDATLKLPSPFPRDNLLVVIHDSVETRFRCRDKYLEPVACAILKWVSAHTGNYMVFFPSYKYMTDVLEIFTGMAEGFRVLCQEKDMDEDSRKAFISEFDSFGDVTRIGFCVMGGIFGEGIDLVGDRLTGVIIVGVGLPQVCPEQEIMRSYYDGKTGSGFSYAYVYPGINRVLQAAGRLIRSETDKGALLLIDSRFTQAEYLRLLPDEWHPIPRTSSGLDLDECAKEFWSKG